jgi:hypothetical protein
VALRDPEDQRGIRVAGHGLEDFARLLGGERGIALEQPHGVIQGDVNRSDWPRGAAPHIHVTNLPRGSLKRARDAEDFPRIAAP